jgi:hypothetical protein
MIIQKTEGFVWRIINRIPAENEILIYSVTCRKPPGTLKPFIKYTGLWKIFATGKAAEA